ncbi:MAG: bifunctional diaminohydroxyphosphoribosylaminopyrimidine deaminase/5-amino-6-(5-phosphoribosylamino)uracil reductase RibD, partial [Bdellovibrionales bacterium]|nr:bifunctional diaminohydroxyphosphoribosylaminopyrimidine deaminase/5-amino-6-(5-phosphoribosylamino)uracil reductase RibD [Bdellovibrionales bacterium]
ASSDQSLDIDQRMMKRALAVARRGSGYTNPNPAVGALLVKEGAIVGRGWHRQAGAPHAEVEAIQDAGPQASGATLYVTLEPCNHHGRTPPCVDAILRAGIRRVVIARGDPNPGVQGGGAERLRAAGVEVRSGVLAREAQELNVGWEHWIQSGRPYLVVHAVVSIDGRVRCAAGKPLELASKVARSHYRRLHRLAQAELIDLRAAFGPMPGAEAGAVKRPYRILVAPLLDGLLGKAERPSVDLVVCSSGASAEARRSLEHVGIETLPLAEGAEGAAYGILLAELGRRGLQSVVCENSELGAALLAAKLPQRLYLHRVPTLVGTAGTPFWPLETAAPRLTPLWTRRVGSDAFTVYEVGDVEQLEAV